MSSHPEHMYVRLRPYNPKMGNLRKRFDFRIKGTNKFLPFTRAGIWYKVPHAIAMKLKEARQRDGHPMSPPVFDVCTEAEARDIDYQAKLAREAARRVVEPTVDTATDMTEPEQAVGNRSAALHTSDAEASGKDDDDSEEVELEPTSFDETEPEETPDQRPSIKWSKRELQAEAHRRGIPVTDRDNKAKILTLLGS